ncbi:spore germination protein [Paenibacillus sp. P96]|uniref:Spore germination protein n=1 Tax=Paenibacillus zeirhizosphaerae TaxID=2987519 RepID=A0ABT9FQX3_9BACL|nr:endospore germination permease [Paenibacillus sp. P96]MDP4097112.1 spore germination protein [Paenibacillus sp. P96]
MDKEQTISSGQLSILFFVFMTGSAIINVPGPLVLRAGNGAWLSLMIAGIVGAGVLTCMLYLHRKYPGLNYMAYSRKLVGPFFTYVFGFMAIFFLHYMQSAIVLDAGLFMVTSMLRETPLYVFNLLLFMVAALTARAGIEVMARMFTLIIGIVIFCTVAVLLLAIPLYHVDYLLPILPKGIIPVMHGVYTASGFPYMEVIVFAMLLPCVRADQRGKTGRYMFLSLGLNIIILCISTVCAIMTLGPLTGDTMYSLFALARLIEFQEIIQRIESVIGMSLIADSYMKVAIALYVLNAILCELFRIKDRTILILPLALIGFLNTLVTFNGTTEWFNFVSVIHPVWNFFSLTLPLLILTLTAVIRKRK